MIKTRVANAICSSELLPGASLPLVLEPSDGDAAILALDDLLCWLDQEQPRLRDTLLERGALLLRGFDVPDAAAFRRIAETLVPGILANGDEVDFGAAGSDEEIALHQTLSHAAEPPIYLCMFCAAEPQGGATPLADARRVLDRIAPRIRDRFVNRGVRYVRRMHGGRGLGESWQAHFETRDPSRVERYLAAEGADFEWTDDDGLLVMHDRPATIDHPESGEPLWFNQADQWHWSNLGERGRALLDSVGAEGLPTNALFGDGSPIDPADLDTVRRVGWSESTIVSWQRGDVMLLDNRLAMHGRTPFEGERRILVATG